MPINGYFGRKLFSLTRHTDDSSVRMAKHQQGRPTVKHGSGTYLPANPGGHSGHAFSRISTRASRPWVFAHFDRPPPCEALPCENPPELY